MTVLTKVFVVALVFLSLLLAAASVTFLNTVPDYTANVERLEAELGVATGNSNSIRTQADATVAAVTQQRNELSTQLSNLKSQMASMQAQLAEAEAEKANMTTQQNRLQTNLATAISAVEANQAVMDNLIAQVNTLQQENFAATSQRNETSRELAVAQNNLQFAEQALRVEQEKNQELLSQTEQMRNALASLNFNFGDLATAGAPAVRGQITGKRQLANGPHASISVGSEDDVVRGMRFAVFDRDNSDFLGFLNIIDVDDNVATGRLEGPAVDRINSGDPVRYDPNL